VQPPHPSPSCTGKDVKTYGGVLVPKIPRAFPDDICRRWIIQVNRECHSEGDVFKLMEFLDEKVDGTLMAQKIRGETSPASNFTPTAATLHVHSKAGSTYRKVRRSVEPFYVFCECNGHWAQECKAVTDVKERVEKMKSANRFFLCLNRGHHTHACTKRARYSAQGVGRDIIGLFVWTRTQQTVGQVRQHRLL
jgi:hypothetical protein